MKLIDADTLLKNYLQPIVDVYGKSSAEMFIGIIQQSPEFDFENELESVKKDMHEICKGFSCYDCPFDIGSDCGAMEMIDYHIDKLKGDPK